MARAVPASLGFRIQGSGFYPGISYGFQFEGFTVPLLGAYRDDGVFKSRTACRIGASSFLQGCLKGLLGFSNFVLLVVSRLQGSLNKRGTLGVFRV